MEPRTENGASRAGMTNTLAEQRKKLRLSHHSAAQNHDDRLEFSDDPRDMRRKKFGKLTRRARCMPLVFRFPPFRILKTPKCYWHSVPHERSAHTSAHNERACRYSAPRYAEHRLGARKTACVIVNADAEWL